ncbi:unnamed protein product [Cochlearia groenlandica]
MKDEYKSFLVLNLLSEQSTTTLALDPGRNRGSYHRVTGQVLPSYGMHYTRPPCYAERQQSFPLGATSRQWNNLDDLFVFADNSEEIATLQAILDRITDYTALVQGLVEMEVREGIVISDNSDDQDTTTTTTSSSGGQGSGGV